MGSGVRPFTRPAMIAYEQPNGSQPAVFLRKSRVMSPSADIPGTAVAPVSGKQQLAQLHGDARGAADGERDRD